MTYQPNWRTSDPTNHRTSSGLSLSRPIETYRSYTKHLIPTPITHYPSDSYSYNRESTNRFTNAYTVQPPSKDKQDSYFQKLKEYNANLSRSQPVVRDPLTGYVRTQRIGGTAGGNHHGVYGGNNESSSMERRTETKLLDDEESFVSISSTSTTSSSSSPSTSPIHPLYSAYQSHLRTSHPTTQAGNAILNNNQSHQRTESMTTVQGTRATTAPSLSTSSSSSTLAVPSSSTSPSSSSSPRASSASFSSSPSSRSSFQPKSEHWFYSTQSNVHGRIQPAHPVQAEFRYYPRAHAWTKNFPVEIKKAAGLNTSIDRSHDYFGV